MKRAFGLAFLCEQACFHTCSFSSGGDDGDLAFARLMLIPSELTLFGRIPKNHSQDGFLNGIPP